MTLFIMTKSHKNHDISLLIKLGMKEMMLNKLNEEQKKFLISYAMEYVNNKEVTKYLIMLASMELQGKLGAAFLASEKLATIPQLKILTEHQIAHLASDYAYHQTPSLIIKDIKEILIDEQQEKIYSKTHGIRGGRHPHLNKFDI